MAIVKLRAITNGKANVTKFGQALQLEFKAGDTVIMDANAAERLVEQKLCVYNGDFREVKLNSDKPKTTKNGKKSNLKGDGSGSSSDN